MAIQRSRRAQSSERQQQYQLSRARYAWLRVRPVIIAGTTCCLLAPRILADNVATSDPIRRSVILTSFSYKKDGVLMGETGPFVNALERPAEITGELPFCRRVWEGSFFGQPVTVVSAGSGKVEVALCTQNLIRHYSGARGIREVIWSGIAGGTPVVGGQIDAAGRRRSGQETMIGDVCISHLALDWDRQYQSVEEATKWWDRPRKANYSSVGSAELAREILEAARRVDWPELPEGPARVVAAYHGDGSLRPPRVFDWKNCGEVTADMFWHGVVEDRRARQILAELISSIGGGAAVSAQQVLAVSACNNMAWMHTLDMWAERTGEVIPFAYSRSLSNYTHPPLGPDGLPILDAKSSIREAMTQGGGEPFASLTAALPVLRLFEHRAAADQLQPSRKSVNR